MLDEREGHTDPASLSVFQFVRVFEGMSENCCVHVLKSVKISFWYRRIFVILLNHCTMHSLYSRMPLYRIFFGVFLESGLGPFIKVVR